MLSVRRCIWLGIDVLWVGVFFVVVAWAAIFLAVRNVSWKICLYRKATIYKLSSTLDGVQILFAPPTSSRENYGGRPLIWRNFKGYGPDTHTHHIHSNILIYGLLWPQCLTVVSIIKGLTVQQTVCDNDVFFFFLTMNEIILFVVYNLVSILL